MPCVWTVCSITHLKLMLLNTQAPRLLKSQSYDSWYNMSELIPFPSNDILAKPQEDHIWLAIGAITTAGFKSNGDPNFSFRKAASIYNVSRSTLNNRMRGVRIHVEAHVSQQKLLPAAEDVLVEWAKVLGRRGVPLTYSTLTTYASEISGKQIGICWPKRFLARHPELKLKMTTSLEKCRAKALNQTAVEGFYDILEGMVKKFDIKPGTYGIWTRRECNWE